MNWSYSLLLPTTSCTDHVFPSLCYHHSALWSFRPSQCCLHNTYMHSITGSIIICIILVTLCDITALLPPANAAHGHICLSVWPVHALTFETLDVKTSLLAHSYIFRLPRTSSYVNAISQVVCFQSEANLVISTVLLFMHEQCHTQNLWKTTLCLEKSSQVCQILTNFQNSCTAGKCMKFAIKHTRHYPPHLRRVATLPWEIKNSNILQIFSRCGRKCKQLHFMCTGFNSSMNVTVYAECNYVFLATSCSCRWIPCRLSTNTAVTSAVAIFQCHKLILKVNK